MNNLNKGHIWDAKSYQEYAIPQYRIAIDALSSWDFTGNENTLDIGCGDGEITYLMSQKYIPNGSILGIDLCQDMINLAKKEYCSDNLNFQALDASQLPFINEFDLVTSFYCIHWIKDQQKVIDGISNSLRNNGKTLLYIMTNNTDKNLSIPSLIQEITKSTKWRNKFSDYQIPFYFETVDSYKEILKNSKLDVINVEYQNKDILFKDRNALAFWLWSLPIASNLPIDQRKELFKEIIMIYSNYFPLQQDGRAKFSLPTIIIHAQKL